MMADDERDDLTLAVEVLETRLRLALSALIDLKVAAAARRLTIGELHAEGGRMGSKTVH